MATTAPTISIGLWYDSQAEQAANFYKSIFPDSSIDHILKYSKEGKEHHGQKEGTVMTVDFQLAGTHFQAINGGPLFKMNPSISLFVVCETHEETDEVWNKLVEQGHVLMPLEKYEWSERYGWLQDRWGLSWQVSLGKISAVGQKITPSLMFVGDKAGKAEEALKFYTSVFKDSGVDGIKKYPAGGPEPEGHIMHAQFKLADSKFMIMDSSGPHHFSFNEAVSITVNCKDQAEIDYYWSKLTSGGGRESMCGWLADKFGVSWQVAPVRLAEMLGERDQKKVDRVTKAFMKMRKFDMAKVGDGFRRRRTSRQLKDSWQLLCASTASSLSRPRRP